MNKHLSQQIDKKFKHAHRRHRTKSRNYKKQKFRRNCFIRQDGKNYIKYGDFDYMSKDNIIMVQDRFDREDNHDVSKGLPTKTKQTIKPKEEKETKCRVKLVFVCDQHKSKNSCNNLEETQYTIQRKSLNLQLSKHNSNINVKFDNDYNAREWWQGANEDENDANNGYNDDQDNQMIYLLYYDYYYDCRRLLKDTKSWKNRFDIYTKDYDNHRWFGLPPMNDFAKDLVGYLLSMYLEEEYHYYNWRMKQCLFDYDYSICSYDINDINDEILNWGDKLNIELNGNNCLSNNLYSMIILQYLFEPIDDSDTNSSNNNNNNNSNNRYKNNSNSDLDFVIQQYKNKSWIELNCNCSVSNGLWHKIMAYNTRELHDASKNDYQYIFQNDYDINNVEINICKKKCQKYSFSHLYMIRKLFGQRDWLKILQQFKIRYLG